jgi:hypothetical protein
VGLIPARQIRELEERKQMTDKDTPRSNDRGGRIDPMKTPEGPLDNDDRIDQAIAESFPASDPPSSNAGIDDDGDRSCE